MLMRKKDRNRLRQSERERERARARICSVQKRHNEEDDKTATSKGKVSEERLTQQVNWSICWKYSHIHVLYVCLDSTCERMLSSSVRACVSSFCSKSYPKVCEGKKSNRAKRIILRTIKPNKNRWTFLPNLIRSGSIEIFREMANGCNLQKNNKNNQICMNIIKEH